VIGLGPGVEKLLDADDWCASTGELSRLERVAVLKVCDLAERCLDPLTHWAPRPHSGQLRRQRAAHPDRLYADQRRLLAFCREFIITAALRIAEEP